VKHVCSTPYVRLERGTGVAPATIEVDRKKPDYAIVYFEVELVPTGR